MNGAIALNLLANEETFGLSPTLFGFVVLVLGMVIIFVGIAVLIGAINLVRLCVEGAEKGVKIKKDRSKEEKVESVPVPAPAAPKVSEGVSPEVVAAITAAVSAYYEEDRQQPEFVVRRNKKLNK